MQGLDYVGKKIEMTRQVRMNAICEFEKEENASSSYRTRRRVYSR